MVNCNNCGRVNDETTRICRYCGTVLERSAQQATGPQVRDYTPPSMNQPGTGQMPQSAAPYGSQGLAGAGYRCPNCQTTFPPIVQKRISSEGWIVFAALLIFCLPLFWVGLLMKEELRVCPACHMRVA
jgi:RNA polymerase subunit RPABC4/transcription elongation factor Spt4